MKLENVSYMYISAQSLSFPGTLSSTLPIVERQLISVLLHQDKRGLAVMLCEHWGMQLQASTGGRLLPLFKIPAFQFIFTQHSTLIIQEFYPDGVSRSPKHLDHVHFLFKLYIDFIALCSWRKKFRQKQEKDQLNIDECQCYYKSF